MRGNESVGLLKQQDLNRLAEFFAANAKSARSQAEKSKTLSSHAFHTGQASAFEAAAGYCSLSKIIPEHSHKP